MASVLGNYNISARIPSTISTDSTALLSALSLTTAEATKAALQPALDLKASKNNPSFTGVVTGVDASMVTASASNGSNSNVQAELSKVNGLPATVSSLVTDVQNLEDTKANQTDVNGLATNVFQLVTNKADKTVTDSLASTKADKTVTDAMQLDVNNLKTNKADKLDPTLSGSVTVSPKTGAFETTLSLNGNNYGTLYFNQGGNQAKMFYNTGTGLTFTSQAGPMKFFPANLSATGNPNLILNTDGTASFNGIVTGVTASPGDNTTKLATTAFVNSYYAPKANPTFTGVCTVPQPALASNDQTVASTSWVRNYSAPKSSATIDSSLTVSGNFQDVLLNVNSNMASKKSTLKFDNADKVNGGTDLQIAVGSEISCCSTGATKAIRFRQGADIVDNDAFVIFPNKQCQFVNALKQATFAVQENLPTSGNVVIRAENTATDGNARLAVKVPAGECRMVGASSGMSLSTDGVLPIRFQPGGNEILVVNPSQATYYCDIWSTKQVRSSNVYIERRCSGKEIVTGTSVDWVYTMPINMTWKKVIFDLTESSAGVPRGRRPSGTAVADWWSSANNGYIILNDGVYDFSSRVYWQNTFGIGTPYEMRLRFRAIFPDGSSNTLWETRQFKVSGESTGYITISDKQFLSQNTVVFVEFWANLPSTAAIPNPTLWLQDTSATPLSLFKIHLVN